MALSKTRKEVRAPWRAPSRTCRSTNFPGFKVNDYLQKAKVDYGCSISNFDKKLSLPIDSPMPPMSPSILPVLPPPFKRKFGKFPKRFSFRVPSSLAGGPPAPPDLPLPLCSLRGFCARFSRHWNPVFLPHSFHPPPAERGWKPHLRKAGLLLPGVRHLAALFSDRGLDVRRG